MSIGLEHYLIVGALLFGIGLYVALAKRNAIVVLMGVEMMLNAVNLTLVAFSRFTLPLEPARDAVTGHVFAIFIITVAAAEAAVALALAILIYRRRETVDVDRFNLLKW